MIAGWVRELPRLRAAMQEAGARLPVAPAMDARWHECDADSGGPTGHYWLAASAPTIAMFRPRGREIVVWQPDDRRLPLVVQQCLAVAAAAFPRQPEPPSRPVRRGRRRRGEVKTWLQQVLAKDPIQAVRIFELAAASGISVGTLRRAADELCVQKFKNGFGASGSWHWTGGERGRRLPEYHLEGSAEA